MKMKTIAKTLAFFGLFLVMASCEEQEPAYKAKLTITPEPYDLEFNRYEEVLFNLDTADNGGFLITVTGFFGLWSSFLGFRFLFFGLWSFFFFFRFWSSFLRSGFLSRFFFFNFFDWFVLFNSGWTFIFIS